MSHREIRFYFRSRRVLQTKPIQVVLPAKGSDLEISTTEKPQGKRGLELSREPFWNQKQ